MLNRLTAGSIIGFAILLNSALAATPLVLDEATIIDGLTDGLTDGAIENGRVVIQDDAIQCVGQVDTCPLPDDAERVNLKGRYITPGLVDAHVHFAQTGWLDGRPDGLAAPEVYPYPETVAELRADPGRWHRAYLCSGITAVFDVGGAPWTVTETHATDTARPDRVHVKAAGPLITHASERDRFFRLPGEQQNKFLPMDTDEQVQTHVRQLKSMGSAAVKVWFLEPTAERRQELEARLLLTGELAREAGLPLIVHATELRGAKQALRAGAAMLVHSVQDQAVDQEFIELLLANDAVYAPTLQVGNGWTRALASVAFQTPLEMDDPNRCVDEAILDRIQNPRRLAEAFQRKFGDRLSAGVLMERLRDDGMEATRMAANLKAVADAGGRVVVATDAGNPLTLHGPSIYREMELMQAAGLSPRQIITAATIEGARIMGLAEIIGSLEPGKLADLIVLAEDPREDVRHFRSLTHVMRRGVLQHQSDLRLR